MDHCGCETCMAVKWIESSPHRSMLIATGNPNLDDEGKVWGWVAQEGNARGYGGTAVEAVAKLKAIIATNRRT